jgi:hypothetical protein
MTRPRTRNFLQNPRWRTGLERKKSRPQHNTRPAGETDELQENQNGGNAADHSDDDNDNPAERIGDGNGGDGVLGQPDDDAENK